MVLCLAAAAVVTSPTSANAEAPPDIVVIVADDLRFDSLPWLDTLQRSLVAKGTTFTSAMVGTSTCCPSRASLLTGLQSHGTGVWSNGSGAGFGTTGGWRMFHKQGMERRSIATWLDPTYRTMLIGKYLNRYGRAPLGFVPPGWDVWHAFYGPNAAYYDYRLVDRHGTLTDYGTAPEDYSTFVFQRLAARAIRQTPARTPLFLFFTPYAPHLPATPAPRDRNDDGNLASYRPPNVNERDQTDKPPWIRAQPLLDQSTLDWMRGQQYASMRSVERAVDAILTALRDGGRLSNTLLIFTSDNGASWGEHRVPIGSKFLPYAAQTRIPLVVRWDGHVAAGRTDGRLAMNVDIPVTIAGAARVTHPRTEGLSLFGTRTRLGFPVEASGAVAFDGNGLPFDRPAYCGFRTKRYLYVRYATGHAELYDYVGDPWELRNVIGSPRLREVRDSLRRKAVESCAPTPPGFSWNAERRG
jgi:arylsulfatase A-like enzyme